METRLVYLIGPPNSGKSTQADLIVHHIPGFIVRISPGDWLRRKAQSNDGSPLGQYIANNWNHDALAPLVTSHVRYAVEEDAYNNLGIVIDGYPRTLDEVHALAGICRGRPLMVIELLLSGEEEIIARGSKRKRYNDDTEDALNIRLKAYYQNMETIRPEMKRLGIYYSIECGGSPEHVFELIREVLQPNNHWHRLTIPPTTTLTPPTIYLELATPIATAIVIQKTINLCQSSRLKRQFCGSHPISLEREHLSRIRQYPYMVSLKADGIRYFCLVWDGRLWFMNRKLQVWRGPGLPQLEPYEDSLVDGELVDNNLFLVLDCLAVQGQNCMHDPILERLRKSIPLGQALYHGPIFFRPQEYVDRTQLPILLKKVRERTFRLDGIIFTPSKLPYRLGIDFNMFKWKETSNNTVDFLYREEKLYCKTSQKGGGGEKKPYKRMGRLHRDFRYEWLRDGMIIECRPVKIDQGEIYWQPCKCREDKPHPNIDWVARNVINSILDDIHLETVVQTSVGDPIPPASSPYAAAPSPMYQEYPEEHAISTPSPRYSSSSAAARTRRAAPLAN